MLRVFQSTQRFSRNSLRATNQPPSWQLLVLIRRSNSRPPSERFASTTTDLQTGHIETTPRESVLFINNVFPIRLRWLMQWSRQPDEFFERVTKHGLATHHPINLIKEALPSGTTTKVTGITPRLKDGAAFVRFLHDENSTPEDIEGRVRSYLEKNKVRPWWNPLSQTEAHLVRGRPWIEDMFRPPMNRLRVEFEPVESDNAAPVLSQEQLYTTFRPYGRLFEIKAQPVDSKEFPKYALVDFIKTKDAVMAKNCVHGLVVRDESSGKLLARLKVAYQRYSQPNWMTDWLANHPRILVPLLAALVASITAVLFDPIRTFSVKLHVSHTLELTSNPVYRWLSTLFTKFNTNLHRRRGQDHDAVLSRMWHDRHADIEQVQTWLEESSDNFIVVQGPRGSGKRQLVVDHVLKGRKNTLWIDCKRIQDARGDGPTIDAAAAAVGYTPVFSWLNSVSGLVDLAAQGAAGIKTGFSETLSTQLTKILTTTSTALQSLALSDRHKRDKDFNLNADDYLEAHPEKRAVVVIDNFHSNNMSGNNSINNNDMIYDKLASWAADLATANTAHVIFLTTDVSFAKGLSRALPDRVFRTISLGDLPAAAAKRFVVEHLDTDQDSDVAVSAELDIQKKLGLAPSERRKDLHELDNCIDALGGRLTDLEFLARRLKAGENPRSAVEEIVEQASCEILKLYLLVSSERTDDRKWTPLQAWTVIREFVRVSDRDQRDSQSSQQAGHRLKALLFRGHGKNADVPQPTPPTIVDETISLPYAALTTNSLLTSPTTTADSTLQSLESADLLTITSSAGRPHSIKPSKPVYIPAFRALVNDKVLAARMDALIIAEQLKVEEGTIEKCEGELSMLGELSKTEELSGRVMWLLRKVDASQRKIEELEREAGRLKTVLVTDF